MNKKNELRISLLKDIREALKLNCFQTSQWDRDFCAGMILYSVDKYVAQLEESLSAMAQVKSKSPQMNATKSTSFSSK